MRMQGDAVTMARLTDILGMVLGRPVVDKTGLYIQLSGPSLSSVLTRIHLGVMAGCQVRCPQVARSTRMP